MPRYLKVDILADEKYCSNSCRFMSGDATECQLFGETLTWDSARKTNGNLRTEQCKNAEIKR